MKNKLQFNCHFCRKNYEEVECIVSGDFANICSNCIKSCVEIIKQYKINEELNEQIKFYVDEGCRDVSSCLGFVKMPKGYALMLNSDESHFFWLRHDGLESVIYCNRWDVYRMAKLNSIKNKEGE